MELPSLHAAGAMLIAVSAFWMFARGRVRVEVVSLLLIAVLALFIATYSRELGLTVIASDFLAAFVVGAIAYTIGPRLGEASPVYAFAPVIPLVPGSKLANAFIDSFNTWLTHPGDSVETGRALAVLE